jgi:lipid II:glycine glycyltransferase (peptidoglycan interpeptide bridge formation enzyme)
VLGRIAQVPLAPVVADDRDVMSSLAAALDQLDMLICARGIDVVVLQPPRSAPDGAVDLVIRRGFERAPDYLNFQLPATALVSLDATEEQMLATMHRKTRYNVGLATRRGMKARWGDASDIPAFFELLEKTAARQNFKPSSIRYLNDMWECFQPDIGLLLAEYEGRPVAGALLVAFGQTVCNKRAAWSGEWGSLHPNELVQWEAILWAKRRGHRYYDFEGLRDGGGASWKGGGEGQGHEKTRGVGSFKAGFGGELLVGAGSYYLVPNKARRAIYRRVANAMQSDFAGRLVRRLSS